MSGKGPGLDTGPWADTGLFCCSLSLEGSAATLMSTKPGGWNKLSRATPPRPTDLRRELRLSSPPSPSPEAEHVPGDRPPWLRGPGAGVFSDTQTRHAFQRGAPCPLPGIFWVVFLLLGYFLFLGNPCSNCQQCFPLTWAKRNQNGWGGAASGRGFS